MECITLATLAQYLSHMNTASPQIQVPRMDTKRELWQNQITHYIINSLVCLKARTMCSLYVLKHLIANKILKVFFYDGMSSHGAWREVDGTVDGELVSNRAFLRAVSLLTWLCNLLSRSWGKETSNVINLYKTNN